MSLDDQPEPETDLDRFRALFDSVGLKYEFSEDRKALYIYAGSGNRRPYADFYFDASGKFISHGVWE